VACIGCAGLRTLQHACNCAEGWERHAIASLLNCMRASSHPGGVAGAAAQLAAACVAARLRCGCVRAKDVLWEAQQRAAGGKAVPVCGLCCPWAVVTSCYPFHAAAGAPEEVPLRSSCASATASAHARPLQSCVADLHGMVM
jgi:hypothetical protein